MSKIIRTESSILEKKGLPGLTDEGSWFTEWLSQNGKNIAYGAAALAVLLLIIFQLTSGRQEKEEADYFNAAIQFAAFEKGGSNSQEALANLNLILTRRPELHAQYDALVAQQLLNQGKIVEAREFAERSLKRIEKNKLPLYRDFAATTLLLADEKFPEALQKTLDLQKTTGEKTGPILHGLNLFRTAFLYQLMDLKNKELKAWDELLAYLTVTPAAAPLVKQMTIGKIGLSDYIEQRKKELKN